MAVRSTSIARPCAPVRANRSSASRACAASPARSAAWAARGSAYGAFRALMSASRASLRGVVEPSVGEGAQPSMSGRLLAKSVSSTSSVSVVARIELGVIDRPAQQPDDDRCAFHRQPDGRFDVELVERCELDRLEIPFAGPDRVLAGIADEQELHVAPADPAGERDGLSFELDRRAGVADRDVEAERDQAPGPPRPAGCARPRGGAPLRRGRCPRPGGPPWTAAIPS